MKPGSEFCGTLASYCAGCVITFCCSVTAVCAETSRVTARSMRLAAKLGFTEVERFEAYGAEQWFGMWSPVTPSD